MRTRLEANMGFFATIGRGWKMSKLSMRVVMKDPELIFYTILCGIMSLVTMVSISIPQFLEQSWAIDSNGNITPLYGVFIFLGYMIVSIVVTFWNSAIVANSHMRLTGKNPTFADGISAATKKLPIIIVWGIIAGTVGLLLKMLNQAAQNKKGGAAVLAQILTMVGATIWWMVTFFMIPHLIIEGKGVRESFSSSKSMFFNRWGENVSAGMGIGLVTFFFGAIIVVISLGLMLALGPLWYIGLGIGGVAIATLIAWSNAAEQVAITALYLYTKNGQMPELYREFGMMEFDMNARAV